METNNNNMMIRHSGRAMIRGKIRRVWRPRHLELCDNGLVRYYELSDNFLIPQKPKCTLLIFEARIIDVTTLRDMHVGLPMGTYGFSFHAQRLAEKVECHAPENIAPRDFLCAVDTLEEAQSWVVALQWAATERRKYDDDWQTDDDLYPRYTDAFQVISTPTLGTTKRKKKQGKIVVTKVRTLRPVRIDKWHWNMAYNIHMLLLSTTGDDDDDSRAEERTIARTMQNVQEMLTALREEVTNEKSKQVLQDIPQVSMPVSYSEYQASLPQVDNLLRTLAMDPHICNSKAMRSFWSLVGTADTNDTPASRIWTVHNPQGVLERKRFRPPENTKDFVQEWLQETPTTPQDQHDVAFMLVWLSQRPWVVVGALACAVLWLPCMIRMYMQYSVSIRLRLDVLLVTWLVAVYVGREYEKRECKKSTMPPQEKEIVDEDSLVDATSITSDEEYPEEEEKEGGILSCPLPQYPGNGGISCWSKPQHAIFRVRGATYLQDRIKVPSAPEPFSCRGVDIFLTDNPARHIARHPCVLGGKLGDEDSFVVNFLLPFGNFVAYFGIPPLQTFPSKLASVWTKFLEGDQEYRDARLKLLPVVMDGPWIVKTAVGPGNSPAVLGKVIPLQYFFRAPSETVKGVYEVDVIISASRIAKTILNVVKGHTKALTIAFAFIIEAAEEEELPETVLCTVQMHSIHLEDCPQLPEYNLD